MIVLVDIKPVFAEFDFDNATYFFYMDDISTICLTDDFHCVECGNSYIISCNASNIGKIKENKQNILGESVRITDYSKLELRFVVDKYKNTIIKTETVDNMQILYCYDKTLDRFVNLFGQKVNIQIAISSNQIDIGYPLILNGF